MAGFGSLYAGIGLAQGLGGMPQAYAQGQQAAQQLAMQKMQQENLGLTRERTLAQMKDEQQLRERLSELSGLGSDLRTALQGTDEEVDQTTLKTPSEQMVGADLFKNTKPSLDLSGKPVSLGAMGSPLTGTPYETKKKKVNTIDYDKVADLKNRMAMGYQQAALLDPRYAALGEKAIQGIDEGILKRTFAAGVTGDVDTISSGLKALTGQEFEITKEGNLFSIKGVGDSAPMKLRLEELVSLSDPANFIKYSQKYAEMQQKAMIAERRVQLERDKLVNLKMYPFVVVTPDGRFIGSSSKQEADELAEQMGASVVRNTEYDYKQAQIEATRARTQSSQDNASTRGQKYLTVQGKPLSDDQIRDINKFRSENPDLSEDEIATILSGQGIQIVGHRGSQPNTQTETKKRVDPETGDTITTTTRTKIKGK